MKILVPIKRVVDYNTKIRVKADQSGIETDNVKMSMNPFDEIAVEEAVRQKQAGKAEQVCAVACGVEKSQDTLRQALAIGADQAILVKTQQALSPLATAKLLQAVVEQEKPELVIIGKQVTDEDTDQTGQMLASLLDWPQAVGVSELVIEGDKVRATCEVDEGVEVLELTLPAVVSADLRLNEPRYVTLPNLMKAKKKPIDERTPEQLGVDIASDLTVVRVHEPAARQPVQMVADVAALVDKLKNEAKVL